MSRMHYHDFTIRLGALQNDVYRVEVLSSPAGQGSSTFRCPVDLDDLDTLLRLIGRSVRGVPAQEVPAEDTGERNLRAPEEERGPSPSGIGARLFESLITGEVLELFHYSLGKIDGKDDQGLRIKLHLDPKHPDLVNLCRIPWELLYRAGAREFITQRQHFSLVRYLPVPRSETTEIIKPPLRILVVASSPGDLSPIDYRRECQEIRTAFETDPMVRVEVVENAKISDLRLQLQQGGYHVLHFIGHGFFSEASGRGGLVFENELGHQHRVDSDTLVSQIQGFRSIHLVLLNACQTARMTDSSYNDPFTGVAAALLMAGMPAVLAMQFPISDTAAIAFSTAFYPKLAEGGQIDSAVTEGRIAVRAATPALTEWATPVLFMRSQDGRLFDTPSSRLTVLSGPEAAPEPPSSSARYILPPGFESLDGIASPDLKLDANEVQLRLASQLRLPVFIRSRADRRPMVLIPGGTAIVGADDHDPDRSSCELPQRRVEVDPFYIDVRPLLVRELKALQPGGQEQDPVSIEAPDTTPAVGISWETAAELARRLGKCLPSEVEWEHAARADSEDRYWWGFPFNRSAAICFSSVYEGPQPVGDRPPNPFGLHDILGNVWEWCEDSWHGSYEGAPDSAKAWVADEVTMRVARGGSWRDVPADARVSSRFPFPVGQGYDNLGVRFVVHLETKEALQLTTPRKAASRPG